MLHPIPVDNATWFPLCAGGQQAVGFCAVVQRARAELGQGPLALPLHERPVFFNSLDRGLGYCLAPPIASQS
jgi:hypothetical protein